MNCDYCGQDSKCKYSVSEHAKRFCSARCNVEYEIDQFIDLYKRTPSEDIFHKDNRMIMSFIVPSRIQRIKQNYRDAILKRDDYECRKCKKTKEELEVHHIYSYPSFFNDPNFSKDVVIALYKIKAGKRDEIDRDSDMDTIEWDTIVQRAHKANHKSNLITLCKECHSDITDIENQEKYFNQEVRYTPKDLFEKNDTIPFLPEEYQN